MVDCAQICFFGVFLPFQNETGRLEICKICRRARLLALHATARASVASSLPTTGAELGAADRRLGPPLFFSSLFFSLRDAPGGLGLFHGRTRYCCFAESRYQKKRFGSPERKRFLVVASVRATRRR